MAGANMDLGGGYGAGAAAGALQQIQQLLAARQQQAFQNELALRTAAREDAAQQQKTAFENAQIASLSAEREALARQRENTAGEHLANDLPPGFIQENDPSVPTMQKGGYGMLLTHVPATQAMGPDFQGPMPNFETPQEAQVGRAPGWLKAQSAKQAQEAAALKEKTDAAEALDAFKRDQLAQTGNYQNAMNDIRGRMADVAGQNADIRGHMADIAGENADLRRRLAEQKDAQGPKLPQREEDTVVSIHQMMPLINDLLTSANARVQGETKPSGYLGQLITRAERGAQVGAYKMGIAQAPDTDKRIQLASLLKILGTVPYLKGVRNMQFIQQIQDHLADPAATDESTIQRLNTLKQVLPGMEQAIYDVQNHGVIPHSHANLENGLPNGGAVSPGDSIQMRAPTGQVMAVPKDQVDHYKSLGATVVQ